MEKKTSMRNVSDGQRQYRRQRRLDIGQRRRRFDPSIKDIKKHLNSTKKQQMRVGSTGCYPRSLYSVLMSIMRSIRKLFVNTFE